jgi:CheY-like chemotaxis protein
MPVPGEPVELWWRNALTWLIAEDEADIRNLITLMIQVWGHSPVAYENGQKVWEWLDSIEQGNSHEALPELVLMDIRMPGKKGNELANRMRTLPGLKSTPIVLMTAFSLSESERMEMIEQDGVDQIIYKPLPDFEQLRILLHNIVTSKQSKIASEPKVVASEPNLVLPDQNVIASEANAVAPKRDGVWHEPKTVAFEPKVATSEPKPSSATDTVIR